jgi:plastocyanin
MTTPSPFGTRVALGLVLALTLAGCTQAARQEAVQAVVPAATAAVVARNLAFEPTTLAMTAGTQLRLVLENDDAGVPHNVVVRGDGEDIAKSEIVTGVARVELSFGPLAAGRYEYVCEVHPNMTGTLTITP